MIDQFHIQNLVYREDLYDALPWDKKFSSLLSYWLDTEVHNDVKHSFCLFLQRK